MAVTSAGRLPALVDAQEWENDWSTREERYELVRGIPTLVPSESYDNRNGVSGLIVILRRALPAHVKPLSEFDVQLFDVPVTIRRPDVLVLRQALPGAAKATASDVLLAVEFVSDASAETDWVHKRAEYATAGIPYYLIADLRPGYRILALFSAPVDGAYPDPQPADGSEVAFTLEGERIVIRLTDLLA